jgi:hypothetical protein
MALMSYTIVGAWLPPRFFPGQTSVFVQSRTRTVVVEASLAPVSARGHGQNAGTGARERINMETGPCRS